MRQYIAIAGLALALVAPALVTPAFAQVSPDYPITDPLSSNPRIRGEQEWWRLVAQADAYRTAHEQQNQRVQAPAPVVPQNAAINNGASASDAAIGPAASQMGTSTNLAAPSASSCPGTNEADQPWHAGEYCLPGGR